MSIIASAIVLAGSADAWARTAHKDALHEHAHHGKSAKTDHHKKSVKAEQQQKKSKAVETAVGPRLLLSESGSTGSLQLSPELLAVKEAIASVRRGRFEEADAAARSIGDPAARKLIEWASLRRVDNGLRFDRYDAFIRANPDWPSIPLLRQRAEARLWHDSPSAAVVRRFVAGHPAGTAGRLALARLELKEGNRAAAEREVRDVWRSAGMSEELETQVQNLFPGVLSESDHRVRMDRRIGAKEFGAAMRAAKRLGSDSIAIVKACEAAESKSSRAAALLDAIPKEARGDLGYALCRLHWLGSRDQLAAAAAVVTDSPRDGLQLQDRDEWWRDVRMLARKLLDRGDSSTAYKVVVHAAAPANQYYRAEYHFMAGWIALRYLKDPSAASKHFALIDEGSADPIVLARGAYWRGRAAESGGQGSEALKQYNIAARYPTAYYGQLARARLGLAKIDPPPPPSTDGAQADVLRAADILYRIGELELALTFVTDFAESSKDEATLNGLGQITAKHHDAQAMLILGKTALARGMATEHFAFPKIGIPSYKAVAPDIGQPVAFSIVRTESGFDQRDRSPANAVGLMQVTPEAAKDTAKRFRVSYDWKRLVSDPIYNMQMGAAELSALLKEYAGSYVLTFAGYNAGRGRVKEWIAKHGDPRDPKIDAVDWVERIPLAETRNYVQRVMENLHIYRAMFGHSTATLEPNLQRPATIAQHPGSGPSANAAPQ
jgi:peptidoglycan lytic transglycosylase